MLNNIFKNNKKNKKTREKSTGRSMVEMLGVLAIIGVLSIGGIAGYTIAMRRHRANEIANVVIKYAYLVYMRFYQYKINNPNDVIVDNHFWGAYACSQPDYLVTPSHDPYNCYMNNIQFTDSGLGGLPTGVKSIEPGYIWSPSVNIPQTRVQIRMTFANEELCQSVANVLSGYNAASDGPDSDGIVFVGNSCKYNRVTKNIPVNFDETVNSYMSDDQNNPDYPDNSYDPDYPTFSDYSDNSDW